MQFFLDKTIFNLNALPGNVKNNLLVNRMLLAIDHAIKIHSKTDVSTETSLFFLRLKAKAFVYLFDAGSDIVDIKKIELLLNEVDNKQ